MEKNMQPPYGLEGAEKPEMDRDSIRRQSLVDQGETKFHKLGWIRLTVCLIVEAIALGSLGMPATFAKLGMVPGVLLSVFIGLIAIYTSYVVGQVYMRHPHIKDYADAVALIWGRPGYMLTSVMFVLFLILVVGSHSLTGTIAWIRLTEKTDVCALAWGILSAVLLFLLAIPPTFTEFAILGYIDFASICIAIMCTIVATGVQASKQAGGMSAVNWSMWPPDDITFSSAFLAVTNVVFAYSFAVCQFSFMAELHTPKDYVKSIWALGLTEMVIYTLTGALVYAFVGQDVKSPALLSAGHTMSRVVFGIALPVIFISGSINGTVACRYFISKVFANNEKVKYINTAQGWAWWIFLLAVATLIGWVVAEAIPIFNDLLGIISSLFISGFTFYFPALFWFCLVKQGKWYQGTKNIVLSLLNAVIFLVGMIVLVCGTYASIADILESYRSGSVRGAFTCSASAYG
ncbi:hypothetical protein K470DRAFT_270587 [Piedraia hortae CBS 480.64]|uniref:Amino acid transporter transmembrane domain-containing protein n=1 Tax=Piedraia hortae CBS 480.64 TaxID=1314780 RepID=A0A6A7BZ62_9PEZI|nr:hypothetical protein K470DRAFT_270587 [Piedraia hortae CBS 480.64]